MLPRFASLPMIDPLRSDGEEVGEDEFFDCYDHAGTTAMMNSSAPPSNAFPGSDGAGGDGGGRDAEAKFDAFSLSPAAGAGSSAPMPSLQSIQQHEQLQAQQRQQQQHAGSAAPQPLSRFDSLPSPEELQGPMSAVPGASDWPPPPPAAKADPSPSGDLGGGDRSFVAKLLACGSVDALRPYFDVDTADVVVRIKGSVRYCMVPDGFRNEVLYSDNAARLDQQRAGGSVDGDGNAAGGGGETGGLPGGKGPDLYGPTWITLTLVFFVAVTSNMSLYLHHVTKKRGSIIDEGGVAAEEEWDYDVNQLLHATWILYTFSFGLPTLMCFVLRLAGVNSAPGPAEMICIYGYSLVPYLPVTWLCIVPHGWVQWPFLAIATILSCMLVVRNVAGSILESGGAGAQGKSGGIIMCLLGCHFVFFLVVKLAFYHHS